MSGAARRTGARRALAGLACALLAAGATGCGSDRLSDAEGGAAPRAERAPANPVVDRTKEPPFVNSLGVDRARDELLLTTNRGFFRIPRRGGRARLVEATVSAGSRTAPVGTFLSFLSVDGGRRLIGSGHPDSPALPEFLGFIESRDGGRSWRVLARLGEADLHKLVVRHGRLYAFDAVLGALLTSRDGGRTFTERFTPRGLVIDFVVDPRDPDTILAATEETLHRSTDGGRTWRALLDGRGIRLEWPAAGGVVRADRDGTVRRSTDRGATWTRVGKVRGEPYKIVADGERGLLLATGEGAILSSADGGATWRDVYRP